MAKKGSKRQGYADREDLTGEHAIGDAGQLVLALVFLAVWVTDVFFFHYSSFLNDYVSLWVRIPLGVVILALAGYLAKNAHSIVFRERRSEPDVIRKGVFRFMRHPMYLGEILLYLGLLVMGMSLAAAGVWVVIIVFLHIMSRYEEGLLLERFGDDYQRYMKAVPMWLPRLVRREPR